MSAADYLHYTDDHSSMVFVWRAASEAHCRKPVQMRYIAYLADNASARQDHLFHRQFQAPEGPAHKALPSRFMSQHDIVIAAHCWSRLRPTLT